ncbi:MAG: UDP-N-acetylmuramoyl-tripeptide--D-alanyl-D-alanine ligase [Gammaproteobacteria bacterium]|nr:UDP-N-acetylmuramoyl-tripeptide--D-alanyl-D-alanine ligase [Gammaproteobacteria bacterium]
MSARHLADVARVTGGRLLGSDRVFTRVSSDTRKLAAGELFVAFKGPHFDGHAFLPQAEKLGAAGALVEHSVPCHLPQVIVNNTRRALGVYAAHWRRQFSMPLIGVTGSSGKTTVKEMLASILRRRGATLATRGNMNNDIGLPLTLLELDSEQRAAVIEMGTNHPGEIGYLARITAPTVGVVTNAGAAHLEFLGSVEGVAREKGALFAQLGAEDVAIINADDAQAGLWRELARGRRQHTFGLSGKTDFHPQPDSLKSSMTGTWQFQLVCPQGRVDIRLSLPGRHNVLNALAAAAAAAAAGAGLDDVAAGLANVPATAGRLVMLPGPHDCRLIDDTYNANPLSLHAAMEFAVSLGEPVWLVLGDMGELGEGAAALHAQCGEMARRSGIVRLFTFGNLSRQTAEHFGAGAAHFSALQPLIEALRTGLRPGITLLVKGSRSMRMERVVEALCASQAANHATNGSH